MKTLELNQMETLNAGSDCGDAGAVAGIIGGVLTIVALSNPITGLIGGLAAAFGASAGVTGIACGIATLLD